MRKLAAVLLLLALLAGCGGGASPGEPANPLAAHAGGYETTANISYKELEATATVSQASPDACTVTFSSPASLKDLAFVFHSDAVDVQYKGLSFQFDPGSVPGGAVANMMVGAINRSMADSGGGLQLTDSGMELSGTLEAGQFFLRLDRESGNLMKLLVPSQELEIEFVNFTFLD